MTSPSRTTMILGVLGAGCMGWGGSSIDHLIGAGGGRTLAVPVFAIGLILLGQLPAVALRERIRALEARLQQDSANIAAR